MNEVSIEVNQVPILWASDSFVASQAPSARSSFFENNSALGLLWQITIMVHLVLLIDLEFFEGCLRKLDETGLALNVNFLDVGDFETKRLIF